MEIHGTEGTIIATSATLPQITPILLMGSNGDSELQKMPVPNALIQFDYLPEGPAENVGRIYGNMAEAISNGEQFHPNFDEALTIHRLLDIIYKSNRLFQNK